jgi:peptidyl-prolyl cis-trans isomerase C
MHTNRFFTSTPVFLAASLLCISTVVHSAETNKTSQSEAPIAATISANEAVATVNGNKIYANEFARAQKVMMSGQPGAQIPADKKKDFEKYVINQLISAELLYQAAQKIEIKDIESQIDAKIAQGKKRFSTDQEFEKSLKALDINPAELREYTKRDLVISNFIQQTIVSKIVVSEDESKKFYDQNLDKFKQDETVKASHILIGVDAKATDADKKIAKEKADKLRKEIAGGADFATVAKGNSTCPSSQQGGDLGFFGKGQMVPAFEKAAFAMKKGDVSDVVETQFGYHIIKVTDKKSAVTVEYKDAKQKIEDYLKGQKVNEAISAYLEEARKKAKIEILMK